MDYRSDTALAIDENGYRDLLRRAEAAGPDVLRFVTTDPDSLRRAESRSGPVYVLVWNDIKWYEDFEDVGLVEDWMNDADSDPGGCFRYAFIRIGEDLDDIEDRSTDDYELRDYIWVERDIGISGSAEECEPPDFSDDDTPEDMPDIGSFLGLAGNPETEGKE